MLPSSLPPIVLTYNRNEQILTSLFVYNMRSPHPSMKIRALLVNCVHMRQVNVTLSVVVLISIVQMTVPSVSTSTVSSFR